jgi:hypothetical protein
MKEILLDMHRDKLTEEVHKKLWGALQDFDKYKFEPIADAVAVFFLSFHDVHDVPRDDFEHLLKVLSKSYSEFTKEYEE